MDLGLGGRIALVAASSRGLGRAIAEELAGEGCDLILCARDAERLAQTRDEIARSAGVRIFARPTDLTDSAAIEALIREGVEEIGPVDVLVTNAGGPPAGPFESHSREAWRAAVQLNLESVLELVRAVLPGMKERGWGRIVNVTSVSVKQPVDNLILSSSVRAAVTGFARTLANEVAPYGVTVNNALPGYTRTRRLEQLAAHNAEKAGTSVDEIMDGWAAAIPMGRVGEPREFAALVAFLASERASYLTGVSITVDGGRTRALL